jgi:hypothetical protein
MGTDQAADPGEGVVLPNQLHSFSITSLTDQAHIAGDIDSRRTCHLAGSRSKDITIARWAIVSFDMTLVDLTVPGQTIGGNLAEPNPVLVVSFHKTVGQ